MIVIIDYGMGNLFSIQAAIQYLGAGSIITSDPHCITNAEKIILPGVGSFFKAMEMLRAHNLDKVVKNVVTGRQTPILGICLGMQLLGLSSTEDGFTEGLGFVDTPIERFDDKACGNLKIPHVGFDTVLKTGESKLFDGIGAEADFYFTHSYRMALLTQPYVVGICRHGEPFVAAFEYGIICGTQFHPEKSQANGLHVLKNFMTRF